MDSCIFCKVANGEIPCNRVYENENFVAFLDINPVAKGHTLLISKKHSTWMQETDDKIISNIFKLAKKIMLAIKTSLGCDYVQVSVIGKDVLHFHIHLIPRHFNDNLPQFPTQKYEESESSEIVKKITSSIP